MKPFRFIAAVAVLSLGSVMIAQGSAAEAKIVNIDRRYSKPRLDAICAREGGRSYGTADTAYGCTKGSNVVACKTNGVCKGYMWMLPGSGAGTPDFTPIENWPGSAELVLEMPSTLPGSGLDGSLRTAH